MPKPSNLSLADYRKFLEHQGLKQISTEGGHEKWTRSDLGRPVIVQTHLDPVSPVVIRSNNATMGLATNKAFWEAWHQCFPKKGKKPKS